VPRKASVVRRSGRSRRRSDALDVILDTFEARARAVMTEFDRRQDRRRALAILDAMEREDPDRGIGSQKPNLSFYDGHVEYHGQD
jgi:prepilin-type processing-associated H-X9-DG protein